MNRCLAITPAIRELAEKINEKPAVTANLVALWQDANNIEAVDTIPPT